MKKLSPTITKQKERKLALSLIKNMTESLSMYGLISDEELNDPDQLFKKVISSFTHFNICIDHRELLLQDAAHFWNAEKYDLAYVIYATWFEHSINFIIMKRVAKNISQKYGNEIVRSLSILAKFSWLLDLVGLPSFNQKHRATIAKVADLRNAFIHYKFPTKDIDMSAPLNEREKLDTFYLQIIKAVRYMKAYGTRTVLSGKSTTIKKTLKKYLNRRSKKQLSEAPRLDFKKI
jgi:hypothetical protein